MVKLVIFPTIISAKFVIFTIVGIRLSVILPFWQYCSLNCAFFSNILHTLQNVSWRVGGLLFGELAEFYFVILLNFIVKFGCKFGLNSNNRFCHFIHLLALLAGNFAVAAVVRPRGEQQQSAFGAGIKILPAGFV